MGMLEIARRDTNWERKMENLWIITPAPTCIHEFKL